MWKEVSGCNLVAVLFAGVQAEGVQRAEGKACYGDTVTKVTRLAGAYGPVISWVTGS